jgi:serine/threonine-protein kinase
MTQMGVILGTAAYMSPEQAKGRAVDKRSDLWAFGVILLEMLTGRPTFHGETVAHVIASVLKDSPDFSGLPANTPVAIRRLLRRCLEKDSRKRIADASDARLEIEDAVSGAGELAPAAATLPVEPRWKRALPWIVAAAAVVSLIVVAGRQGRTAEPTGQALVRIDVDFGVDLADPDAFAISPDGQRLAYLAQGADGVHSLVTRRLGDENATTLVANVVRSMWNAPFFSPDSQWVGFFADRKLKKVPVEGGAAANVADAIAAGLASWGEAEIVTSLTFSGALSRVPVNGGPPVSIPGSAAEAGASVLPGGRALLFYSRSLGGISVMPASGEAVLVAKTPVAALQYVPGYILYADDTYTLGAIPFDAGRLTATGAPFPLMEGIDAFSASLNGTLVVHRGTGIANGPGDRRVMKWLDASGATDVLIDQPDAYASPRLSPDGRRMVMTIRKEGRINIWVRDLEKGAMTQLTFEEATNFPLWLDAQHVLFGKADGVYVIRVDRSGQPKRILDRPLTIESVSPDGTKIAATVRSEKTARDIVIVPLEGLGEGVRAGAPAPFLDTDADEINPAFSPDGRWIAYAVGGQGMEYAVYVRPASGASGQWLVPGSGLGFKPVWAPAGKRLFFQMGTGELMTTEYSVSGESFVVGPGKTFGSGQRLLRMGAAPTYVVSASGTRVGTLSAPPETLARNRRASHTVFLNFLDELERRAAKVAGK